MSQEECARLREGVPYVEVYRYNTKHLRPKLNGYGDNGQRSLKLWQLLLTYLLPNTYKNWQEYVVSVMLISVLNIKLTCEWYKAIQLNYKNTRTHVIVVLRLSSTIHENAQLWLTWLTVYSGISLLHNCTKISTCFTVIVQSVLHQLQCSFRHASLNNMTLNSSGWAFIQWHKSIRWAWSPGSRCCTLWSW